MNKTFPEPIQGLIDAFTGAANADALERTFRPLLASFDEALNIRSFEDYYIFTGMRTHFEAGINGLKVAEVTNIRCAPAIAGEYYKHERVLLILRIEGVPIADLKPFQKVCDRLDLVKRLLIVDHFRRMLAHGYVETRALEDTSQWFIVDPDREPPLKRAGELYLFGWDSLVWVRDAAEKLKMLDGLERRMDLARSEAGAYEILN